MPVRQAHKQTDGGNAMAYAESDNGAVLAGYTVEYLADCDAHSMHISVRPDADLDGTFRAFDHDNQEYVHINGWLWTFEPIAK